MQNKKGFTLVELLAVIAILGVLLTLATINIIGVMNKGKKDVGEFTKQQIEDAAKTFALDHVSCEGLENFCEEQSGKLIFTFNDKETIINHLKSYYPEIEEKCTFDNNAKIIIESSVDDIKVPEDGLIGIECK